MTFSFVACRPSKRWWKQEVPPACVHVCACIPLASPACVCRLNIYNLIIQPCPCKVSPIRVCPGLFLICMILYEASQLFLEGSSHFPCRQPWAGQVVCSLTCCDRRVLASCSGNVGGSMRVSAGGLGSGRTLLCLQVGGVTSHLAVSVAADGWGTICKSLLRFLPRCSAGGCGGCHLYLSLWGSDLLSPLLGVCIYLPHPGVLSHSWQLCACSCGPHEFPNIKVFILKTHTCWKEMTTTTMVKVGDRVMRESDLDLEKCFCSCSSTEARRLRAGVAHSHRGMCRVSAVSVAEQGAEWMRVEISWLIPVQDPSGTVGTIVPRFLVQKGWKPQYSSQKATAEAASGHISESGWQSRHRHVVQC